MCKVPPFAWHFNAQGHFSDTDCLSQVLLLVTVSRSDMRKPIRKGRESKLTKITQVTSMILCLRSQLSQSLPPLSVHVRRHWSTRLSSLQMPYNCHLNCVSPAMLTWEPLILWPWPSTLISLLSPLPQAPTELLGVFWGCQVVSGLGTSVCTAVSSNTPPPSHPNPSSWSSFCMGITRHAAVSGLLHLFCFQSCPSNCRIISCYLRTFSL